MVARGVLTLEVPDARYQPSFLAAAEEFEAEGSLSYASFDWMTLDHVRDREAFTDYVDLVVGLESPPEPLPPGRVPMTERWMVVDGQFVGRISLRHQLNEVLLQWGGHFGYAVRPTARGRGYATRALELMLPVAAGLGIEQALVTCDEENHASRRIIEGHGGVYEDSRDGKRRYWMPTYRRPPDAELAQLPAT